jgi:dihydrofolate reductase
LQASVFVGTSVDGFIARPNDALDFLDAGGGEGSHGFEEFMATVDALVMGRRSYEVVLPFNTWPYGNTPVFVLTSKAEIPAPPAGAVVERMAGTPEQIVATLEQRGFRHIYVDGGQTIQAFLRAGLITRLVISHVPVLIGSGISLFGPLQSDVKLTHVGTREFQGGMVQSEYLVANPAKNAR